MTEEKIQKNTEEKKKTKAVETSREKNMEKQKVETSNQISEQKTNEISEKKEDKKSVEKKLKIKKEEAVVRVSSLPISKKQAMYICRFIKNKPIDVAIMNLTEVTMFKKAVPFRGEIPHRKGPMTSGRYPIKASKLFINLLKGLKGNAIVNGLELEKTRISFASPSWSSRPPRSDGRSAKRTHVLLKAKEFTKENI